MGANPCGVGVESVGVADRTQGNADIDDRFTALAELVLGGFLDDGIGSALAFGHDVSVFRNIIII